MPEHWIKYNPTSGEVSAGGWGIVVLIVAAALIGIYLFWGAIVNFLLFFGAIVAIGLVIYGVIEYLNSNNRHGGYY